MIVRRMIQYHLASTCDKCGKVMLFQKTPFMTNSQRVCPHCGHIHYCDEAPIDFGKIAKGVHRG